MPDSLYDTYRGLYTQSELKKVKGFLQDELTRSFRKLKTIDPPAYLCSYLFRNQRSELITARLGGIVEHRYDSRNTVYCDVRVGNYEYDNVSRGGLEPAQENEENSDLEIMPSEPVEDSFRFALWKLTDQKYRESTEEYYNRKSRELHFVDPNASIPARVKRKAISEWKFKSFDAPDTEKWIRILKKLSKSVKHYQQIKNSGFELVVRHEQSIFVNTEGSCQLRQSSIYELRGFIWILSENGEPLSQEFNLLETDEKALPDEKKLQAIVNDLIQRLQEQQKVPQLNSYSGPVLLSPIASALFFHEVIGHRLEGSRLLSPDEGSTFRDLHGKKIAPDFIDIFDDPTVQSYDGRGLLGSYTFDDEGSPAEKAELVVKGVLRHFLTGRAPLPGQTKLNGHGRNQKSERPISRMGNLFIQNHKPLSDKELKEMFLNEIRSQGRDFGIYIKDTLGGETDTASYDFQAFKGEILYAVKVYPDGKEEAVRGVDFVGTPLSALDSVMGMGDTPVLENSYCGAESGVIPVSTIAPALLLKNLELQSRDRERYTPYFLPLPYK